MFTILLAILISFWEWIFITFVLSIFVYGIIDYAKEISKRKK